MKRIFILLLAVGNSAAFADSLVCTGGPSGGAVPCSTTPFTINAIFPKLVVLGNTLSISSDLDFGLTGVGPQYGASVSGVVNDKFTLPSSPAGDVLQFQAVYGAGGQGDLGSFSLLNLTIGPGSSAYPEISLDPYVQPPAYCPPGSSLSCSLDVTLPASDFSFVSIQSSATLVAAPSSTFGGEGSAAFFTIYRFKADGVTPDPFTVSPEPASSFMALLGACSLGFAALRRRCRAMRPNGAIDPETRTFKES